MRRAATKLKIKLQTDLAKKNPTGELKAISAADYPENSGHKTLMPEALKPSEATLLTAPEKPRERTPQAKRFQ
ncbi:hypothetical protein D8T48_21105 [Vibrio vulnificus]|nr:hypothetical protein D8T48_21105 [Vibrio vulnificus]